MSRNTLIPESVRSLRLDMLCHGHRAVNSAFDEIRFALRDLTSAPEEWHEDLINDILKNYGDDAEQAIRVILRNRVMIALMQLVITRLVSENRQLETFMIRRNDV